MNNKKNPEIESKVRLCLIIFAVLIAAAVAVLILHGKSNGDDGTLTATEPAKESKVVEEQKKDYTPTFMYFVTKKDDNYDEYMAVVSELQKEYEGRVTFEISDIDEESEAKENFGDIIALGTPALIMLNTKNEPCAFVGKCVDKAQMTDSIESALGGE